MRTTVTIDDDVLFAVKEIARRGNQTIGKVISELARKALQPPSPPAERNGIPLLPVRQPRVLVTQELVDALRDDGP